MDLLSSPVNVKVPLSAAARSPASHRAFMTPASEWLTDWSRRWPISWAIDSPKAVAGSAFTAAARSRITSNRTIASLVTFHRRSASWEQQATSRRFATVNGRSLSCKQADFLLLASCTQELHRVRGISHVASTAAALEVACYFLLLFRSFASWRCGCSVGKAWMQESSPPPRKSSGKPSGKNVQTNGRF
jgi:hypothetical protein